MPHTAESLTRAARVAVAPRTPNARIPNDSPAVALAAIEYAATSALEEFEELSFSDLRLILTSIVVLAS